MPDSGEHVGPTRRRRLPQGPMSACNRSYRTSPPS